MRVLLTALFAISAASVAYLSRDIDNLRYSAADLSIELKKGFKLSHSFVPEVDQRLCLTIARSSAAPLMDEWTSNDPQGIVANYRITSAGDGHVVTTGQYPPETSAWRSDNLDYRGFGGFQPVRGQMYDVTFEVVTSSAVAEATDARLGVRIDPVSLGKGAPRFVLFWALALAALICGFPLLQRRRR